MLCQAMHTQPCWWCLALLALLVMEGNQIISLVGDQCILA